MNSPWRSMRTLVSRFADPAMPPAGNVIPELVRFGIEPSNLRRVSLHPGRTVALETILKPHRIETRDLAEYKSWVGIDDAEIDLDSFPMREEMVPTQPWSGRAVSSLADLTPIERDDVERAQRMFLFGYAPWVEGYREVIERCFAPFHANVFCADSLRIAPQARLVVEGTPAVLIVNHLTIEDGGQIALFAVCRAWIGTLEKKPASPAH